MNRSLESAIRFVNLTASGLLAGSLGFGEAALVPGWEQERPTRHEHSAVDRLKAMNYFNAIGPVALATSVALAVASRAESPMRRVLDSVSAIGLAGVLAATILVTVPANKELELQPATDYPSDRSQSLVKNWGRAHAVRTTLGIGAFICAVASGVAQRRKV